MSSSLVTDSCFVRSHRPTPQTSSQLPPPGPSAQFLSTPPLEVVAAALVVEVEVEVGVVVVVGEVVVVVVILIVVGVVVDVAAVVVALAVIVVVGAVVLVVAGGVVVVVVKVVVGAVPVSRTVTPSIKAVALGSAAAGKAAATLVLLQTACSSVSIS